MTQPETIVCKPTPWFLIRASAMILMFTVFAVMFYRDGTTGYRKKNEAFYLNKAFAVAVDDFSRMKNAGSLTADEWSAYAARQVVPFPKDSGLLPTGLQLPVPWPPILQDYEKMRSLQKNFLWKEYTSQKGLDLDVPEKPFTADKIREQWIVMWVCVALLGVTLFFLLRTLRRSIRADGEGIVTQNGSRIPYAGMKRLDLRKWETKGLAFIEFESVSGKGRARIDGLTYGGFKKEQGEPAEQLMKLLRSRFSGEIIEYAPAAGPETEGSDSTSA